ncbi:hypothetical protein XENTR_v10021566 [Xenopus tropicalis]|uniref:Phospholipase B1, membrane-associated n=1 Tax=Xenopus tropicalis TaxID=8364 RepID=A0A8J0SUJ5_XENTR|nr:phospholipase B1, membrane-associated [Xenopus tropicalis]KAE8586149.1 hypothetical protein XENTR_v10021566 [Xenopus tropicalis]
MRMLKVIIFSLCLHQAYGLDWFDNYMSGLKTQIPMYGLQEFPEKAKNGSSHNEVLICPDMSPSAEVPTTVEKVKPADVKVVAALGDSLTTAIAANATSVLEIPNEYRHLSWSIGGFGNISDVTTLPNILKLFNPNIVGFGKRKTVSYKPAPLEDTGLNLAVTGANTFNLPEQTQHLIDTMKSYPGVNFKEDWKLVTIFIGSNDVCDYCKNKTLFSADSFIHNLTVSLDMLQQQLPRAIINVVQLLRIEELRSVNDKSLGCLLQRSFCSCVAVPNENSTEFQEILDQMTQFQEKLERLFLNSTRFNGKKDFAVILQPFLKHAKPPTDQNGTVDYSYFTPDCFHLTIKGHEQLARALWNNMLQPQGDKYYLKTLSDPIPLLCPSKDHPYFYTRNQASGYSASHHLIGLLVFATLLVYL